MTENFLQNSFLDLNISENKKIIRSGNKIWKTPNFL